MTDNTVATNIAETAVDSSIETPAKIETLTPESKEPLEAIAEVTKQIASEPTAGETMRSEVDELTTLKAKMAEYEKKISEITSQYNSVEEEAKLYRPKKDLLNEVEGLSAKALSALKKKDLWDLLDASGIKDDELYEKIATGRPKLSTEDLVERRFNDMLEAQKTKEALIIREREAENMKLARKQVTSWLDITDTKTIAEDLLESHEILKFAKEDQLLDVEGTLIDMVTKSGVTYPEAVKTLAEVLETKALKMTSLKKLDKALRSRYSVTDIPVTETKQAPSKEIAGIKTLGSKIEDAPKVVLKSETINGQESFDEMINKVKKNLSRIPSNLR